MDNVDSNAIMQVALVVKDIMKTAEYYSKIFGMEFPLIRDIPFENEIIARYRGEKLQAKAKLCVFRMGCIALELIQPVDDCPSSWREFLEMHGQGVHHVGVAVNDKNSALKVFEDYGINPRHEGVFSSGSEYTIVDSEEKLGVMWNIKQLPGSIAIG